MYVQDGVGGSLLMEGDLHQDQPFSVQMQRRLSRNKQTGVWPTCLPVSCVTVPWTMLPITLMARGAGCPSASLRSLCRDGG